MKIRSYTVAIAAGLWALSAAGCVTVSDSMSNLKSGLLSLQDPSTAQVAVMVPERKVLRETDVPSHARFVLAAVLQQMRHQEGRVREVLFDRAGQHRVKDPRFDFAGFEVFGIDIGDYRFQENSRQLTVVQLSGMLHFADGLGRRTSSIYSVRYELRPGRPITVRQSEVSHIAPAFPEVRAFFVPAHVFKEAPTRPTSFAELYRLARSNALPMRATAAEIAEKEKRDQLSAWQKISAPPVDTPQAGDYLILVFCMERLGPESEFTLKVMDTDTPVGESLAQPIVLDDAGFRVAIAGGQATLYSPVGRFFTFALYKPQPDFGPKSILLGRYVSEKAYPAAPLSSATASTGEFRPVSAVAPAPQGLEGPLGRGEVFLNPSAKTDAILIQSRLARLGYYAGGVDGLFGPGSKASLRAFRNASGLGDSAAWDLRTQKVLFQGSGQ